MRGEHQINLACECGSTLKTSSLPEHQPTDEALRQLWLFHHVTLLHHELCTTDEARSIRDNELRRRAYDAEKARYNELRRQAYRAKKALSDSARK